VVLVMNFDPGFGGQRFIDGSLEKVAKLRSLRGDMRCLIAVDGA
jgi:pentose-5-phosphate-3-epimerase